MRLTSTHKGILAAPFVTVLLWAAVVTGVEAHSRRLTAVSVPQTLLVIVAVWAVLALGLAGVLVLGAWRQGRFRMSDAELLAEDEDHPPCGPADTWEDSR